MGVDDKCGVVVTHSLDSLLPLAGFSQNRGKNAIGIGGMYCGGIDVIKAPTTVKKFLNGFGVENLRQFFSGRDYHTFIAHLRYATISSRESGGILSGAHPRTISGVEEVDGDYVTVRGAKFAIIHNGQVNPPYIEPFEGSDSMALLRYYLAHGEERLLTDIPASYTAAIADTDRDQVLVFRDRLGMKPGSLAVSPDGSFGVVSEEIAFRKNGWSHPESLVPGVVYYLDSRGGYTQKVVVDSPVRRHCFFEWNYILRADDEDAIWEGVSVKDIRRAFGRMIAKNVEGEKPDFVTYVPRAPKWAAIVVAEELSVPFIEVFEKKDPDDRSFQGATLEEKVNSINNNLHVKDEILRDNTIRGKRVKVIDDSRVRAVVSSRIEHLMYDVAGVDEAELDLYTPPLGIIDEDDGIARWCELGVDMPYDDDFIARGKTREEIGWHGRMKVWYPSISAMLNVFEELGMPKSKLCYFCIGGPHPIDGELFPKRFHEGYYGNLVTRN